MSESILVGLVCDERYFKGLLVTVVSVLLNTKTRKNIEFHIIDGGIEDASWDRMVEVSQSLNSKTSFVRHNVNLSSFEDFPKWNYGSPLIYSRLFFSYLTPSSQVIYLDTDILFGRDIEELWEMSFEENVLIAVQDHFLTMSYDCKVNGKLLCDSYGIPRTEKYFNAGVIKINLNLWRQMDLTSKVIEWLEKYNGNFMLNEQTALNFLLYKKVKFVPFAFNTRILPALGFSLRDLNDSCVMHFVAKKKPWMEQYPFDLGYQVYKELLKRLNLGVPEEVELKRLDYLKFRAPLLAVFYFGFKSFFPGKGRKYSFVLFNFYVQRFNLMYSEYYKEDCRLFMEKWMSKLERIDKINSSDTL